MGEENTTAEPQYRIDHTTGKWMVLVALVCDLFLPVGAVGGAVIFLIWFYIKGVPLINPARLGASILNVGGNGVLETASVSVWPGITIGVMVMIYLSRLEDRTGINITRFIPTGKNPVSAKGFTRGVKKTARRMGDVERTERAMERLETTRARKAARGATAQSVTSPQGPTAKPDTAPKIGNDLRPQQPRGNTRPLRENIPPEAA